MNQFKTPWLCLSVLFAFASHTAASVEYSVTNLGPGMANAINASGEVVGASFTTNGYYAFAYNSGSMTEIGPGMALGMNANGEAVGVTGGEQAFAYSNGVETNLTPFGNGQANGINNSGQIVGYADHAFTYSNGVSTFLIPPGSETSYAYEVNANGEIVGGAGPGGGVQFAFAYSNGVFTPLGTLPAPYNYSSYARAINASGEIMGESEAASGAGGHGFLYIGGTMIDLGTLGGSDSNAEGINDSGQVVGSSYTGDAWDAFVYSDGGMTDLNALISPDAGWTLESANGINDAGQIVGYGVGPDGMQDAFLLTPVPEPDVCGVTMLALAGLLLRRHRK